MSWSYLPFNQTLKKVKNTNKIPRKMFLSSGNYPIISQEKDFINGYWNCSDDLFRVTKPVVIFGDHTKVVKLVGFDFVLGADGVKVFLPSDEFDSAFYYYFLLSVEIPDLGYARHFKLLSELMVPTPPLEEQKRIVAILDSAFEQIDQAKAIAQQNLQNAREIFDSALKQFFNQSNWVNKRFDEICVLQRGFDLPTRLRKPGSHPLISSSGETDRIDEWKVPAPGVVTGRSGSIGKVHFIDDDYWPLNTALYVKEFFGNDKRFIYYFLMQFDLSKYASGAGVPTLNRNHVHAEICKITIDIQEQMRIAEALDILSDNVKYLESIYQQKIAALDELKQSLLQQAFSGKLTVNHSGAPV